jgi:error-prone DNA polymerase
VFVELRAHTGFSFGDGTVSPEALVTRAIALGYTALGITDTADLGGVPRFVNAAVSSGQLRPIVGAELRVDGRPAAFLVRTAEGYRNLAALVTRGRMGAWASWTKEHGQERRGRPNVTWREVAELNNGLVALTGPATGPIAALVRGGRRSPAALHRRGRRRAGRRARRPRRATQDPVGRRARPAVHRQRRPPRA